MYTLIIVRSAIIDRIFEINDMDVHFSSADLHLYYCNKPRMTARAWASCWKPHSLSIESSLYLESYSSDGISTNQDPMKKPRLKSQNPSEAP